MKNYKLNTMGGDTFGKVSEQANQTFLFKRTTKAAYIMTDNGSTFECIYSS